MAFTLALLVAALAALPGAEAQRGLRDLMPMPGKLSDEPSEKEDDDGKGKGAAKPGQGAQPMRLTVAGFVLSALFLAGLLLLAVGLVAARRSRGGRKTKAPPRRSFDAGRLAGHGAAPLAMRDLAPLLQRADLGRVLEARGDAGSVVVAIERRRSVRCEHAAGYLVGVAEALWACDVEMRHACPGKRAAGPCVYQVVRKPSPVETRGRLSGSAGRGAAASTPGSAAARHRSPPARAGGG